MESKESCAAKGEDASVKQEDDQAISMSVCQSHPITNEQPRPEKLQADDEERRKQTLETNAMKARERRKRQKIQRDKEQDFITRVSQETAELKRENEQLRYKILSYERILNGHPLLSTSRAMIFTLNSFQNAALFRPHVFFLQYGNVLAGRPNVALMPAFTSSLGTTNSLTPTLHLPGGLLTAPPHPRAQCVSRPMVQQSTENLPLSPQRRPKNKETHSKDT